MAHVNAVGAQGWQTMLNSIVVRCALVAVMLLCSTQSRASVEWLLAQQRADGAFTTTEELATPFQATAETLRSFRALGASAPTTTALAFIAAEQYVGTEYLSRKIIAATGAGVSADALVTQLLTYQNVDGGFGELPGYDSSILDTGWALDALAAHDSVAVGRAIAYLISKQSTNGSWSEAGNVSSVYLTALASASLQRHGTRYAVSTSIAAATSYLYGAQRPQGGWGHAMDTAMALLAVVPVTTDSTRHAAGLEVLRQQRAANEAWENDPYTTALALRALSASSTNPPPPLPTVGAVTGQVIDSSTGLPLNAASIAVSAELTVQSGADGRFFADNLIPGNYSLRYTAPAFQPEVRNVSIAAGQRIDVGIVPLAPAPTTGSISGIVTVSDTRMPIAGAQVRFEGAEIVSALTDANGAFALVVPPGQFSISVTAASYHSIQGSGALSAGAHLTFSPALVSVDVPPPTSGVSIEGTIVDADDATPLSGVSISLPDLGVNTITATNGSFVIETAQPGELRIQAQRDGYQTVTLRLTVVAPGAIDIGTIRLRREAPATTTLSGTVTDAVSGQPIVGARVLAAGVATLSDALGRFELGGITALAFTVDVSAPGYVSYTTAATLLSPAAVQLPVQLVRPSIGGIVLQSWSTSIAAADAYQSVPATLVLMNTSDEQRSVVISVRVSNESNVTLEQFSIMSDQTGGSSLIEIPAGAERGLNTQWFTRNLPPGIYTLTAQVYDQSGTPLYAEAAALVSVRPTQRVSDARLFVTPAYSTQGASEELVVNFASRNLSNVPTPVSVAFELLGPNGEVLREGMGSWILAPDTLSSTHQVDAHSLQFGASGTYPLNVTSASGISAAEIGTNEISVAPNIRIEIAQGVDPQTIPPDGDRRIRMRLRIEGVETP